MSNKKQRGGLSGRNPVARHANKFNRSTAFKDRTRYRRNEKHKGTEPFAKTLSKLGRALAKGSML